VLENMTRQAAIGASLLSQHESSLLSIDRIYFNELSVSAAAVTLDTEKPLWSSIAILAFCVLLCEWWYFHRRR
jgi:hypothetical protein